MQNVPSSEAERAAKMQSMLRLNLSIRDGSANVYWKHDGERFSNKSKGVAKPNDWQSLCSGSTLKLYSGRKYQLTLSTNRAASIRPNSGRWDVKEIDAEGREVQPQFQVQFQPALQQPHVPLSLSLPNLPPPQLQPQSLIPGLPDSKPEAAAPTPADAGDVTADPRAIKWVDVTADAARSTYTAILPCSLTPTGAGRRHYLLIEAYVEDFGLVVCPLQIKVYKAADKSALSSFPLRFVQYDFREDSSSIGDLFAVNFYRY